MIYIILFCLIVSANVGVFSFNGGYLPIETKAVFHSVIFNSCIVLLEFNRHYVTSYEKGIL